jgi:hypothetical protein
MRNNNTILFIGFAGLSQAVLIKLIMQVHLLHQTKSGGVLN